MGGRLLIFLVISLIFSGAIVSAADAVQVPPTQASASDIEKIKQILQGTSAGELLAPSSYTVNSVDLAKAREDLIKDYKAYSDEQFMAFDGQIHSYMLEFRSKMIMAALGVNFLVAGLVFYYLNKKNKQISYQSVALTRQRSEEERQYIIQNMVGMRDQLRQIEERNAKFYDSYVIPMQRYFDEQQARWQREEQIRRDWERANQANAQQDFQQGDSGWGGDYGGGAGYGSEGSSPADSQYQAGFSVEGGYSEGYYEDPHGGGQWS